MSAARSTSPNTADQSGWSDTLLVGAAVGLIIGTPVVMALSIWPRGVMSPPERLILLVLGLSTGAAAAGVRRRHGARPPDANC